MPEGVSSKLGRILRNFFWEGHEGSKLNCHVNCKMVNKSSLDVGLDLGDLKIKNLALLAKLGVEIHGRRRLAVVKGLSGASTRKAL